MLFKSSCHFVLWILLVLPAASVSEEDDTGDEYFEKSIFQNSEKECPVPQRDQGKKEQALPSAGATALS